MKGFIVLIIQFDIQACTYKLDIRNNYQSLTGIDGKANNYTFQAKQHISIPNILTEFCHSIYILSSKGDSICYA